MFPSTSPTSLSPALPSLGNAHNSTTGSETECPPTYNSELTSTYTAGTEVEVDRVIYQCNPYPFAIYCTFVSYQPMPPGGTSTSWTDAWSEVGGCVLPTSGPSLDYSQSPSDNVSLKIRLFVQCIASKLTNMNIFHRMIAHI